MDYEEPLRKAAERAQQAVTTAIRMYRKGEVAQEEDITAALVGIWRTTIGGKIDGLVWSTHILTRKGPGTEERALGADLIIHVSLSTPKISYSKGVLIQAKRVDPDEKLRADEWEHLQRQCRAMLNISSHSWIFGYSKAGMRCGPAGIFVESASRRLYHQCVWTSYRFFLELFRCPVGDFAIMTARVRDLPAQTVVEFKAESAD